MARQKATRESNLRSSIYQGEDGYWHGRVTMGVRDNGTPDRRHVMSKDKATVTAKVRRLERQRDDGVVIRPGRAWTVESGSPTGWRTWPGRLCVTSPISATAPRSTNT